MSVDVTVDANAVLIDGKAYKLTQSTVNVQDVATFAPKATIGDYSKDSNPILSSWVINDLSAGHGVTDLQEGADVGRYRAGVVDARTPNQIAPPPLALPFVGEDLGLDTGAAYPLGALGANSYALFGTDIALWDEDTLTFSDTGDTVSAPPTNRPTVWSAGGSTQLLYIPFGSSGYATYDGSSVTAVSADSTHPAAVDFLVWDYRLLAIDDDGQLWQTFDGSTWESTGAEGKLDASVTPRSMEVYFDRNDTYVPYIITDREVYAIDMAGPTIYRTELFYPRHRDMGLGAANWRGDLHVAVGMGVFRYNGSVISPIGLDRDQGLPPAFRGTIVDLLAEYNGMWALVAGAQDEENVAEAWAFDGSDDDWYVNPASTFSSLHVFTGIGWHCYWTSDGPAGTPTFSMTTCEDDTYRLWWGVGNVIYTMELPIDFSNSRSAISSGVYSFAPYAYLQTGKFDAAMSGYTKLGNAIQVQTRCSDGCRIDISYRVDNDTSWEYAGSASGIGETTLVLGAFTDYGFQEGIAYQSIEFMFEFYGDANDASKAAILEVATHSYLKLNKSTLSFTVNLDLSAQYDGRSAWTQQVDLAELMASDRFFSLVIHNTPYRVRMTSISGGEFTGMGDFRSQRIVGFIQVKESFAV